MAEQKFREQTIGTLARLETQFDLLRAARVEERQELRDMCTDLKGALKDHTKEDTDRFEAVEAVQKSHSRKIYMATGGLGVLNFIIMAVIYLWPGRV